MELKSRSVPRKRSLTNQELAEHIKAVGEAIAKDANEIVIDTHNLMSFGIEAKINPCEELTTISYVYERYSDPRRKENN